MLNTLVNNAVRAPPDTFGMETMGSRIRAARALHGLSQQALGRLVGVTKGAVSQWENGSTKNIKLETFLKLVQVLHTEPAYLIFGADSRGKHPPLAARWTRNGD